MAVSYTHLDVYKRQVTYCPTFNDAEKYAVDNCRKGDMLITMGAGDVYKIGEKLVRQ